MTPTRDQFLSTVLANTPLCREHYRLVLRVPISRPPGRGNLSNSPAAI